MKAPGRDIASLVQRFRNDRRFVLMIRDEDASLVFTAGSLRRPFEAEGHGAFGARQATLGHRQQRSDPMPFDRTVATRCAARAAEVLLEDSSGNDPALVFRDVQSGRLTAIVLDALASMVGSVVRRLGQPGPS